MACPDYSANGYTANGQEICDRSGCLLPATHAIDASNCRWCAGWYIEWFCEAHWREQMEAFRREHEENQQG